MTEKLKAGPFHVSRSSDGEREWFSARDPASGVSIPARDRADASALVASLNQAFVLHTTRPTPATDVSAEDEALERYGVVWVSPTSPNCMPMDDGYWTPWHIANAALQSQAAKLKEVKAEWDEALSIANDAGELLKRQEAARLAAEARLAQMRADVVEECAAVADQWLSAKPETALMIGTAIRDLAGKGAV